jgi:hypothetical protein
MIPGSKPLCSFIRESVGSTAAPSRSLCPVGLASFCALEPSRIDLLREGGRS